MIWPMKGGWSLSEGEREKQRGRGEKRTRGANNNKTHCKWNNEGIDDTDEEKRRIYALE
jgi:hypothetical protein